MKKIAVLGFSGSIGDSVATVMRNHGDKFNISFASAHTSSDKLFAYALEFGIEKLVFTGLEEKLTDTPQEIEVYYGKESLLKLIADSDIDILLNAISGSAGLEYSIATVDNDIDLALANKESLVMAGDLLKEKLKSSKSKLLPVDSEHSAIFQALQGNDYSAIKKLYITASGGSFLDRPLDSFDSISVEDALLHPNWSMGKKITVDSATMLNKAFEVIEAHHLFGVDYDNIVPIIHRQSIVHSMVEYVDGSILAQMSSPSMVLPVLYALTYPHRFLDADVKTNLFDVGNLSFEKVDKLRYPLYYVGVEAGKIGGIAPTVLNSASEVAVMLFLEREIKFNDICKIVSAQLEKSEKIDFPSLEEILEVNKKVYNEVLRDFS